MKKIMMVLLMSSGLLLANCAHAGKKSCRQWNKMDADGDNVVTRAEFDKAHDEKFKMMDANGDGKITKEEKMNFKKNKKKGKAKKACCK